jgi:hypothetical protein
MKDIVGFTNYTINENGEVYSKYMGRLMKQCLNTNGYYVVNLVGDDTIRKYLLVHRLIYQIFILEEGKTMPDEIDHINNIKTDNSKDNLRGATHSQNQWNRWKYKNNTSGHKNICITQYGTFEVKINHTKRYSKSFKTLEEAIADRDVKIIEFHGEFANNGNS